MAPAGLLTASFTRLPTPRGNAAPRPASGTMEDSQ